MKTPGFYDNAYLHNSSDVSSLTEIQYWEIEPSEKETHSNESMRFKMFYLHEYFR